MIKKNERNNCQNTSHYDSRPNRSHLEGEKVSSDDCDRICDNQIPILKQNTSIERNLPDNDTSDSLSDINAVDENAEKGYLADCEYIALTNKHDSDDVKLDNDSQNRTTFALPESEGTISLYRVRQGKVLYRALKASYLSMLAYFVCCVLQLYAVFGNFGILTRHKEVKPWSWLVFQTVFR